MNNIVVSNLSPDTTEQDIRSIFAKHGTIERFKIQIDSRTDQPKAFVEMANDAEAEKAIIATNGTKLKGKALAVNAARPQINRRSRPKRD